MSAITGIHYADGRSVSGDYLSKMVAILAHRGTDAKGIWQNNSVGFGHRLLHTTSESLLEKLPLTSDSETTITADARIDNRQDLIIELGLNSSAEITDSQLILAAYDKWGKACVEKLIGDFAFAIWDAQHQRLFCARDHLGVRPFYYHDSGTVFVFASEIKALFCHPKVPRRVNKIRVAEFLTSELYDKTITIYQDIFRLAPAHTLTVEAGTTKIECYWQLDYKSELKLDSDAEYAARFREIFTEAVRCRLRSAQPVGSMLSGGLDSSSITCIARQILAQSDTELHTFSAVFDRVAESDESYYINSVVRDGGITSHLIHGDEINPLVDLEKIVWHYDEPQFAANLYINWETYKLANQLGVRVVLDGFDGDSAVSHGFGYMRELARAGRWRSLIPELRGYCKNFHTPFLPTLWAYYNAYAVKPGMAKYRLSRSIYWRCAKLVNKLRRKLSGTKNLSSLSILNTDLIEQTNYRQHRQELVAQSFISTHNEREEHYNAINIGSIPTTLELLDKAAAAHNIELRYPFWDIRLVQFCLSLPANQKMRDGLTRMIMRRGLKGILPPEIQQRGDKGNLTAALDYGLRTYGTEKLTEVCSQRLDLTADYINLDLIKITCQNYLTNYNNSVDIITTWKSLNLALWFELNCLK